MALKPTIYKLKVNLSDLDRHHYETLNLTVAQHPSEKVERMMARVLAYCINDEENLSFTKGLSVVEEPDIWARTLDDQLTLWVDVGEPAFDRIKKASRMAQNVIIYTFNSKSDVWWSQEQSAFSQLDIAVFQFQWESIQALAALVQRTMNVSITISDNSAYIATESGECEIVWKVLQA